jgi:translation initiation factor 1
MSRQDRLVYSSGRGRLCASCGRPVADCACRRAAAEARTARGDGVVRVRREVKGRRGKTVTTLSGIPLGPDALSDLAAELKRQCGTGGSSKDGVIEIQGDHRDRLVELLEQRGYRVVRAGG